MTIRLPTGVVDFVEGIGTMDDLGRTGPGPVVVIEDALPARVQRAAEMRRSFGSLSSWPRAMAPSYDGDSQTPHLMRSPGPGRISYWQCSTSYQNWRVSGIHHGGAESSERALVDGVRGESEVRKSA